MDTDLLIEEQEKKSIKVIFENKGEAYFRLLEKQILENIKIKNTIVATGGGMIEIEDSFRLFKKIGTTVYLRCSEELLLKRVRNDQLDRPNFRDESQFKELYLKRIPFYEKADIVVDCDLLTAEQIGGQIQYQIKI